MGSIDQQAPEIDARKNAFAQAVALGTDIQHRLRSTLMRGPGADDLVWLLPVGLGAGVGRRLHNIEVKPVVALDQPYLAHRLVPTAEDGCGMAGETMQAIHAVERVMPDGPAAVLQMLLELGWEPPK